MKVPVASSVLTLLSVFEAISAKAVFEFDTGFPEKNGRLYGGEDIKIKDVPHMVQIEKDGQFICGATIINLKFVLTAAHCLKDTSKKSYTLRVGSGTLKNGGISLPMGKITKHPKYKHRNYDYDVAVIELDEELEESDTVKCLKMDDKEGDVSLGEVVQITGWGKSRLGGRLGPSLKKVGMAISSRETCRAWNHGRLTSRSICASQREKALCIGDAGNPLVKFEKPAGRSLGKEEDGTAEITGRQAAPRADAAKAEPKLIGVASKIPFYYCNRKGAPFIFTDLKNPEITDFLKKELKKETVAEFC